MGYIIGLDVGDVRIGIAVSDYSRLIASPLSVLTRQGWGPDTRAILSLCGEYDTTEVVSGLPRNMDGSEGFQAQKVREFCNQLEKQGLTVYYQDERLTTVTAEDALREGNIRGQERRRRVDKVAAAVILQAWLDRERRQTANQSNPVYRRLKPMSESFYEDDDQFIELEGDDGETVRFEHIATIEYEGNWYLCLTEATDEDDESEEAEITILRIDTDENDEEIYTALDDEELEETIFQLMLEKLDEADDEEED